MANSDVAVLVRRERLITLMKKKFLIVAGAHESLVIFRGELLRAILKADYEVHVCAPDFTQPIKTQLEQWGVHVHSVSLRRAGINPLLDLITLFQLVVLMRKIKPDALLSYTIKPVIYGLLAGYIAHVQRRYALITGLGYSFMSGDGYKRLVVGWIAKRLYAFSLSFSDKVFFQNPDDEQLFRELGLLSKTKTSFVVNGSGVDLTKFTPSNMNASQANVVFLMIARLLGDKGVREYAAAAKLIKSKHALTSFLLVGGLDENPDSIQQSELQTWIKEGYINYLGKLSDVRPAIEQSSVYVLPSYREGTPRTVLEAMAMGKAIITTDAPGCRETVIDGDNGFLIPVKSIDELANAMEKFIVQPQLIHVMGNRSRQIVELKYDVHQVNSTMMQQMGIITSDLK